MVFYALVRIQQNQAAMFDPFGNVQFPQNGGILDNQVVRLKLSSSKYFNVWMPVPLYLNGGYILRLPPLKVRDLRLDLEKNVSFSDSLLEILVRLFHVFESLSLTPRLIKYSYLKNRN